MKDWLFYPVCTLVVGAIIVFAMSFSTEYDVDPSGGLVVEGEALRNLTAAPGTLIELDSDLSGSDVYAVMSANARKEDAPSAGIFVALSPGYQKVFFGHPVRFSVEARSGTDNGSDSFEFAFFSPKSASGWRKFELTDEFKRYGFEFTPENIQIDYRGAYFGIWPDETGDGRTVHVRRMWIERINPE
ncbi:MAG: hypothetical protein GDA39_05170 [Hyphomonadaceae bacterium]|nr:hypothetical protein [Hyphomonadaceae bacterium]MBC6412303.1 hypothetical protein [Hyphomonadaceae bacterium]